MDIIRQLETEQMKPELPEFNVGDTVDVHYRIREGEKDRIQIFHGTIISVRGAGIRRSILVRRLVAGEGVERSFPLHSPRVADIVVKRRGKVRRAKLYYLRDRVGKATKVREVFAEKASAAGDSTSGDGAPEPKSEKTKSAAKTKASTVAAKSE
jgi:large subunit ribosomal protein L19